MTVVFFESPIDITPTTTNAWTDIDVSSHIPSTATGVMGYSNAGASSGSNRTGWRKNGSTTTHEYFCDTYSLQPFHVGVDGSHIFEFWCRNLGTVWLTGYFEDEDADFITNPIDIETGANAVWTDHDISSYTNGDAIAVLIDPRGGGHNYYGLRCNGSTDEIYYRNYGHMGWILKVDGGEIFEGKWDADNPFYYYGYIKDTCKATFHTNGVTMDIVDWANNKTWSSYQSMDNEVYGATGYSLQVYKTYQYGTYGIRPRGWNQDEQHALNNQAGTYDDYDKIDEHSSWIVRAGLGGKLEGKMNGTTYFRRLGYFGKASPKSLSSVSYQVSADDRDGQETNDTTWVSQGDDADGCRVGEYTSNTHDMGMAWTNVQIPKGALIISARIELFMKFEGNSLYSDVKTDMQGFDVDNVAAFSSSNRPSQITQTTAKLTHTYDGRGDLDYKDETWMFCRDATEIIQEIVDRQGWERGNAMGVVLKCGASPNTGEYFQFQDYGRNTSQAAKITIEYLTIGNTPRRRRTIRQQVLLTR